MHELDEVLKHWGVKGMKWDETKRKDEAALNDLMNKYNLTPEQAKNVQALAEAIKAQKEQKGSGSDKSKTESEKLADEVIKGLYGNGEERKKKLGDKYAEVQALVNEKLKGGTSSRPKSKKKSTSNSKPKGKPSYQYADAKQRKALKSKPKPKGKPSYQYADAKQRKALKTKLKPKKPTKHTSYIQKLKKKTKKEIKSLLSKWFNR